MPKLEVLVGPIASGKSTYARWRADRGAIIICFDDLTQMVHGGRYRYEADLKPTYLNMMSDLAWNALVGGRDVVADRTHLTRASRAFWVGGKYQYLNAEVVAVRFPMGPPAEHARRRFESDDRGRPYPEWLAAAQHHAVQAVAEPLDWADEGFDELELLGAPRLLEMARENAAAKSPAYLPPRGKA